YFGMPVNHVMNLTDVDDKTIRGALKAGMSLDVFTGQYKRAFFEDLQTLNIEPADQFPEATKYIPQMISMIQKLIDEGVAYRAADGSIYYSISKFPAYGRLSRLKLDELQVNASESNMQDEYSKDHIADFVLWKKHDPERDGEISWPSPFGPGRPGWHSECSVMAQELLGETIDIHAGGVDLIFPHHENEIAQAQVCSHGKPFSYLWVHVEHLLVDNKKMSKSLGNFYTLRNLQSLGYSGRQIRFLLMQTHYRMQLHFSLQALDAVKGALQRIDDFIIRLEGYRGEPTHSNQPPLSDYLLQSLDRFSAAIADDLNMSEALAVIFDLIRHVNVLCDKLQISQKEVQQVLSLFQKFDMVLGILSTGKVEVPDAVQKLVEERTLVRREKNFKRSDEIRSELAALGWTVEDTPDGPRVKRKDEL
ncbi:MAG TPA: cysteine--tRNA ligase, partial [Chlamydiales bacterium]|nr:cysteine--tRNA ligase [Chlamydiales bacterium]